MDEVSCPSLEHEVGRLFDLLRSGVVHFNNLEGFSIGCVSRRGPAGGEGLQPYKLRHGLSAGVPAAGATGAVPISRTGTPARRA